MAELFGFSITRSKPKTDPKQTLQHHERTMVHKLSPPVVISVSILTWKVKRRLRPDLIRRYREIALHPRV